MENQHALLAPIAATARHRLARPVSKEKLLDLGRCVDVDGAADVAAGVLVVEAAVDDLVGGDAVVVGAAEEGVHLCFGFRFSVFGAVSCSVV